MRFKIFFFIAIVCLLPLLSNSCRTSQAHQQQKEIEKRKAERKKEVEIQYQDAVKRHQNMQSKDTRKRMQQTQKQAKKINKPKKKKFFLFRWFSKNDCVE